MPSSRSSVCTSTLAGNPADSISISVSVSAACSLSAVIADQVIGKMRQLFLPEIAVAEILEQRVVRSFAVLAFDFEFGDRRWSWRAPSPWATARGMRPARRRNCRTQTNTFYIAQPRPRPASAKKRCDFSTDSNDSMRRRRPVGRLSRDRRFGEHARQRVEIEHVRMSAADRRFEAVRAASGRRMRDVGFEDVRQLDGQAP